MVTAWQTRPDTHFLYAQDGSGKRYHKPQNSICPGHLSSPQPSPSSFARALSRNDGAVGFSRFPVAIVKKPAILQSKLIRRWSLLTVVSSFLHGASANPLQASRAKHANEK
jgi:hypothetical protein